MKRRSTIELPEMQNLDYQMIQEYHNLAEFSRSMTREKVSESDSWYKTCNSNLDLITYQPWKESDLDIMDIVFIKWGNETECYNANDFRNFIQNDSMYAIGNGNIYLKIWPHNHHVLVDSIIKLLFSDRRYFKAKSSGKINVKNLSGNDSRVVETFELKESKQKSAKIIIPIPPPIINTSAIRYKVTTPKKSNRNWRLQKKLQRPKTPDSEIKRILASRRRAIKSDSDSE